MKTTPDMYSTEWFETFAATVPSHITASDVDGISVALPLDRHPRVLDVGCGIGRVAGPLARRGYTVTGLDVSLDALRIAQRREVGPRYLALDQRHAGRMRWTFDGALLLWNSLGYLDRGTDVEILQGVGAALRPGGRIVLDLYHPDWLAWNERPGEPDDRGAVVRRWMSDGRCFNEIRYPSGRRDEIHFNVYSPGEMRALADSAGLTTEVEQAGWDPATRPSPEAPRYQLVCTRA